MSYRFVLSIPVAAVLLFLAAAPGKADPTVPLSVFEAKVDTSLAMQAAGANAEQFQAALQGSLDKSGPQITALNEFGPRHELVPGVYVASYFRDEQTLGVRIPIMGARAVQLEDVAVAKAEHQAALLETQTTKLQLLADVRQYYIAYWAALQDEQTAQGYIAQLASQDAETQALQKNGFWTSADMMGYDDLRQKAAFDLSRAQLSANDALIQLSSVAGSPVAPFTPVQPDFSSCDAQPAAVLSSALASDIELAKLNVQKAEADALVRLARVPAYDVNLDAGVGGAINSPGGFAYNGFVGIDYAGPIHERRFAQDEVQRVLALQRQYGLLVAQRKALVTSTVDVALANRTQASWQLAQTKSDELAIAEDAREAQVRFASISPNTLADVQAKAQLDYTTLLAINDDQGAVLERTNELLMLAPDACSTITAGQSQQGTNR